MSVGILKRLLALFNIVAVIGIALTVWSFMSHRSDMQSAYTVPDFNVPVKARKGERILIDNTGMPLGMFPKPVEAKPETGPTEKKEALVPAIAKLGSIKSAIVVYPPYEDTKPALIFEYKVAPWSGAGTVHAISVGTALVTRPHSDPVLREYGDRENVRYKFVRCEPDPENAKWTLFVFDVNCDGKTIEKARWKGDVLAPDLPKSKEVVRKRHTSIYRDPDLKKKPEEKPSGKPIKRPDDKPVITPVKPPNARLTGPIFEDAGGSRATTEAGMEYLRNNYSKVLKEAHTTPYKDKTGKVAGVRIRAIAKDSIANEFGILKNDVILAVNSQKVRSKTQAVNVVKRELNKKPAVNIIEVKILRAGRTKTLRFDARDPATRRKATSAFRDR